MRALVFALSLLAVAAPSARAEEPVLIRPAQPADPQAALAAAMEGRAVPAMGVLVIRNGRVASETVRGVRRLGQDAPAAAGDLWHLGSDTKPMTATLVVLLAEEAKLSWTARLDQMLPELADEMRPEYRDVTLADLLSHRSGLPENAADEAAILAGYDDPRPLPEQRLDYVRRALTEAPVAPARGEKHYSNTGFILAAVIAERAMGRSYEALMTERVFAPLGMTTATFSEAGEGELTGHVDGRPATQPRDPNPAMWGPAGRLRMSLADWGRFSIDQMEGAQGRGRLLKPESYLFMQTPQVDVSGLGWGVVPRVLGRQGPALTHSGSDGNWNAIVMLFPETGDGLLVVANAAESMGGDAASVAVARALLPDLAPPAPAPAAAP